MILSNLLPGKQEIIDKLFPSGWEPFVVQVLAILVLVLAVFFLLFKPIRKNIQTRQNYIEENIRSAEEKNKIADANLFHAHQEVKDAHIKAQNIMVEAEKNSMHAKEEAINRTNEEIKDMKLRAEQDIIERRKKADEDIRKEIIDVAFLASEKILEREINKKDNEKIVDDFINSLKEDDSHGE